MKTNPTFDILGSFEENGEAIGSDTIGTFSTLAAAKREGRRIWENRNTIFTKELRTIWIENADTGEIVDGA